jgi:hypothetical protein
MSMHTPLLIILSTVPLLFHVTMCIQKGVWELCELYCMGQPIYSSRNSWHGLVAFAASYSRDTMEACNFQ